jgi:hypothetical protein
MSWFNCSLLVVRDFDLSFAVNTALTWVIEKSVPEIVTDILAVGTK